MVTKGWSYARVLLENPNIKQQLVDFLEIQASKISGLYLQKVNVSWKENIQFHEESQKYVYYTRNNAGQGLATCNLNANQTMSECERLFEV